MTESLPKGTDLVLHVEVVNSNKKRINNIALSCAFASGWEVGNNRLSGKTSNPVDYEDFRDDRVYAYFSLGAGQRLKLKYPVTVAYEGKYISPAIVVKSMYDHTQQARTRARWITVKP